MDEDLEKILIKKYIVVCKIAETADQRGRVH